MVCFGGGWVRRHARPVTVKAAARSGAGVGRGFVSDTARVNRTTLHYVRGGTGPAVILLDGFPEDWYAYHRVMRLLAKQLTVVAVDLRGIGGSAVTTAGYDAANVAEDVHQLAERLHLEHVYVVGHYIGDMVAYAFARRYPETSRGVMMLDIPLPGPWAVGCSLKLIPLLGISIFSGRRTCLSN